MTLTIVDILLMPAFLATFPSIMFGGIVATELRLKHLDDAGQQVTHESLTPTGTDFLKGFSMVFWPTYLVVLAVIGGLWLWRG